MNVDLFDFALPREMIAERPAEPRDSARLLRVGGGGLSDAVVHDLPRFLRAGDLLVSNDTRVIPARLFGRRGAGKLEVTLTDAVGTDCWKAFAKPAKRVKPGETIHFAEDFTATMVERGEGGEITLRFDRGGAALMAALERHGAMPLPPYIKRERGGDSRDRSDYQTLFAARPGAVAAPTAGLHFTPSLLGALDAAGIRRVTLTLHVGAGTFMPVTAEETSGHKMHAEWGEIDAATAEAVNHTRRVGGRIVAVGSTSTRLLESAAGPDGIVAPWSGKTDIFITPGYRFRAVDLMMTNFHVPRSTLFMLVCAFAGMERMTSAYEHAKASGYRFFSYGDACLLEPQR